MMEHNPHYSTSAKNKWLKIGKEILKYAIGVILGGIGVSATGCASVPFFIF